MMRPRALASLIASALLTSCAAAVPVGAGALIEAHTHSDDDFRLTPPTTTFSAGAFVVEGALCRRFNSDALSPSRLLITGYDAAGKRLFRETQRVTPLNPRTDETCHTYRVRLPAGPAPSLIDIQMIPYGETAPPRLEAGS